MYTFYKAIRNRRKDWMKLREISGKTGISKRNIHFYIKEGLLRPDVAPESGYYEFSEEEEKRLLLIKKYRNAGLSIPVIRSLLEQPSTAGFFLTWQVIRLKQQAAHCSRVLSGLNQILDDLPLHPDLDTLFSATSGTRIPETPRRSLSGYGRRRHSSGKPFPVESVPAGWPGYRIPTISLGQIEPDS